MKRFMLALVFILLIANVVGCAPNSIPDPVIYYQKDYNTDLCFSFYNGSLSNVPCTEKVEKLLENKRK